MGLLFSQCTLAQQPLQETVFRHRNIRGRVSRTDNTITSNILKTYPGEASASEAAATTRTTDVVDSATAEAARKGNGALKATTENTDGLLISDFESSSSMNTISSESVTTALNNNNNNNNNNNIRSASSSSGKGSKSRIATEAPTPRPTPQPTPQPTEAGVGVRALEYLGTGYNIFEGNPRGSETSELDPGFRASVIKLVQDTSMRTLDQSFSVPLGTELRFLIACEFSSTSTELSSVDEYQSQLSSESTVTETSGFGFSFLFFSYSNKKSFSKSQRYSSFASSRTQTRSTGFESRAFCTEVQGHLQKYYEHELEDTFKTAMDSLPVPFVASDNDTIDRYRNFIEEYGTHYVTSVELGAKRTYMIEMNSEDVLTLRQEEIDVATEVSSKTSFSFEMEVDLEASIPVGPAQLSAGTTISNSFNVDSSSASTTSDSERVKNLKEISTKVTRVTETNVGGTPPASGNWQEWAKTAAARPMPMLYTHRALIDVMPEDTAVAFFDAIQYFYDDTDDAIKDIDNALTFGVADKDGRAISTYTFDPVSNQRSQAVIIAPPTPANPTIAPSAAVTAPSMSEAPTSSVTLAPQAVVSADVHFFTYDLLWDGSTTEVSAVFATFIRDNISPNVQEDQFEQGFLLESGGLLPRDSLYPIGLTVGANKAKFGAFARTRTVANSAFLNSFSYLAVDSLANVKGLDGQIVVGVVDPQGYARNEVYTEKLGFEISQTDDNNFIVTFDRPFKESPTMIVFPMWFPKQEGVYPRDLGQIQIGLKSCSIASCNVQVGANTDGATVTNPIDVGQFLGFTFLAIDGSFTTDEVTVPAAKVASSSWPSMAPSEPDQPPRINIVHGIVDVDLSDLNNNNIQVERLSGSGFKAISRFNYDTTATTYPLFAPDPTEDEPKQINFIVSNQIQGGVSIEFDTPFLGIPSVIVTPVPGDVDFTATREMTTSVVSSESYSYWCVLAPWTCFIPGATTATTDSEVTNSFVFERVMLPFTIVESITKKGTFIKAGLIDTTGANPTEPSMMDRIYTPVRFHFVAIGPVDPLTG